MAIIYKICATDETFPDYICDPCGEPEKGRVRGVAYIHKDLKSTIDKTNVESRAWWENGIESELIKIVPSTRGTFDGGTKQTVAGFGDEKEKIVGKTFVAVINDQNHTGNELFYQALENNFKDYIFAFRTGSELRIANDVILGLEVKDNVEEDTESDVFWQATVTWEQNRPKMIVPIYDLSDDVKSLFTNCLTIVTEP